VRWTSQSETALVEALKDHQLDIAIGGFDRATPWSSRAGVSQPFATDANGKKHVFLAAAGENGFILELDRFLVAESKRRKDPT
jgi:polar amino acid transport system substrate-binding protein